jgi:FkbM family methyltransferase
MLSITQVARATLPYLPDFVLARVFASRPYLAREIPPGRSFIWPYYADDIRVYVDNGNAIEGCMLKRHYDIDIHRAQELFVRPGHVCMDIGANVGAVTLALAKAVGPLGLVIAVEPGPPYIKRLRKNISLNTELCSRIRIEGIGIGDTPGILTWDADPERPCNAMLFRRKRWTSSGNEIQVKVETVDSLVWRLGLSHVNFIKIDVESMELEVLRGAADTMRACRPVIMFETMEWARDHRLESSGIDVFSEIDALLNSLNYVACEFADHALRRVNWGSAPDNTIAVPKEMADIS